jgi:hypothetical protein
MSAMGHKRTSRLKGKKPPTEGGLIEVHYSPFRNIAHRAFPGAHINIRPA